MPILLNLRSERAPLLKRNFWIGYLHLRIFVLCREHIPYVLCLWCGNRYCKVFEDDSPVSLLAFVGPDSGVNFALEISPPEVEAGDSETLRAEGPGVKPLRFRRASASFFISALSRVSMSFFGALPCVIALIMDPSTSAVSCGSMFQARYSRVMSGGLPAASCIRICNTAGREVLVLRAWSRSQPNSSKIILMAPFAHRSGRSTPSGVVMITGTTAFIVIREPRRLARSKCNRSRRTGTRCLLLGDPSAGRPC